MLLKAKPGFEQAIKIADAANLYLVLISIVGLFLEYTPIKTYVILVNQVVSLIFVADFLLRLVSFPAGTYFFKGYGWVDFLASLPGFLLILGNTPLLSLFKVVRVGRFFKILRVLRFLRVFSFLKQMKADSPWIQSRIMKIGISVVLVFVVGIIGIDSFARYHLEKPLVERVLADYERAGKDPSILAKAYPDTLFYSQNGLVRSPDGTEALGAQWLAALGSEYYYFVEIPLERGFANTEDGMQVPLSGILLLSTEIEEAHNGFMLILLGTLVGLLLVIIFYLGMLFANDMRVVQLVVDSIDADDFYLLNEEANKHRDEDGSYTLEQGEIEMLSLLKMAGKLAEEKEYAKGNMSMGMTSAKKQARIDPELVREIVDQLEERSRSIAVEAVKISAPAILKFIKQKNT